MSGFNNYGILEILTPEPIVPSSAIIIYSGRINNDGILERCPIDWTLEKIESGWYKINYNKDYGIIFNIIITIAREDGKGLLTQVTINILKNTVFGFEFEIVDSEGGVDHGVNFVLL